MCDPLSIALGTVALGSKVAGDIAGNAAANKMGKATIASANASFNSGIADIRARKAQELEAAQLNAQRSREMSLVELGLVQASAASTNVAGASVDAAGANITRRAAQSQDLTTLNLDNLLAQLDRNAAGLAADRQGRINTAPRGQGVLATTLDAAGFGAQLAIPMIRGR